MAYPPCSRLSSATTVLAKHRILHCEKQSCEKPLHGMPTLLPSSGGMVEQKRVHLDRQPVGFLRTRMISV